MNRAEILTKSIDFDRKTQGARCLQHQRAPNRNGSHEDHVMAKRQLPSLEVLRQLLRYDPETGNFVWLERSEELFEDSRRGRKHDAIAWNSRFAGTVAGTPNNDGYTLISVFDRRYRAHRLAWLMHHGVPPVGVIDHINGKTSDNRIANLRDVSHMENTRNSKLAANNTSGVNGVSRHRRSGKWSAFIRHDGRQIHLGLFLTKEEAVAARSAADALYMYHPNHGRSGGQFHG